MKVELISHSNSQLAIAGALACHASEPTHKILEDLINFAKREIARNKPEKYQSPDDVPDERAQQFINSVIPESFGRGHGSVADQSWFAFAIEGLPRAATLQLCCSEYLCHLQQSLRFALADDVYIPEWANDLRPLISDIFEFYQSAVNSGVPPEDARYILPLWTRTNILTSGNARELMHLYNMNRQGEVPQIVQETIASMVDQAKAVAPELFIETQMTREPLEYWPAAQIYASKSPLEEILWRRSLPKKPTPIASNDFKYLTKEYLERAIKERDEACLSLLKHVSTTFLVPLSLAAFHQLIRQRTLNQTVESIYSAADRRVIVIPQTIEERGLKEKYIELALQQFKEYAHAIENGIARAEAIGLLPHALQIYDLIHVNGWNAIHFIGKRTCKTAQWEIRGLARDIANKFGELYPEFRPYIAPQGMLYGKCPERSPCAYTCPTFPGTNPKIFYSLK